MCKEVPPRGLFSATLSITHAVPHSPSSSSSVSFLPELDLAARVSTALEERVHNREAMECVVSMAGRSAHTEFPPTEDASASLLWAEGIQQ